MATLIAAAGTRWQQAAQLIAPVQTGPRQEAEMIAA